MFHVFREKIITEKRIEKTYDDNFNGGHSVVFKSYIKDGSGNIIGLNFYDYTGIGRNYLFANESKIFLGANLIDIE